MFAEIITEDYSFKLVFVSVQTDQRVAKRPKAVISDTLRWHRQWRI